MAEGGGDDAGECLVCGGFGCDSCQGGADREEAGAGEQLFVAGGSAPSRGPAAGGRRAAPQADEPEGPAADDGGEPSKRARLDAPATPPRRAAKDAAAGAAPPRTAKSAAAAAAKDAASAAGADPGAAAGAPQAEKAKVTLRKIITSRIRALNDGGQLGAPLRLAAVAAPLSRLAEDAALGVLEALEKDPKAMAKDPTAWVKAKAKRVAELAEQEEHEWIKWDKKQMKEAGERGKALPSEILDEIKRLNRSGALAEPILLWKVAGPLLLTGPVASARILRDLEKKGADILYPSSWICRGALNVAGRVMERVEALNRGGAGRMDLLADLDVSKVRDPLTALPEAVAMQLLEDLEAKAVEVADPTSWILLAVEKQSTKVGKELRLLNEDAHLAEPIRLHVALEALSQLDEADALRVVRRLKANMAKIKKPTHWLMGTCKKILEELNPKAPEAPAEPAATAPHEGGEPGAKRRRVDEAAPEAPAPSGGGGPVGEEDVEAAWEAEELGVAALPADAPADAASSVVAESAAEPSAPPQAESLDDEEAAAWRALKEAFGEEVPEPAAPPSGQEPRAAAAAASDGEGAPTVDGEPYADGEPDADGELGAGGEPYADGENDEPDVTREEPARRVRKPMSPVRRPRAAARGPPRAPASPPARGPRRPASVAPPVSPAGDDGPSDEEEAPPPQRRPAPPQNRRAARAAVPRAAVRAPPRAPAGELDLEDDDMGEDDDIQ